ARQTSVVVFDRHEAEGLRCRRALRADGPALPSTSGRSAKGLTALPETAAKVCQAVGSAGTGHVMEKNFDVVAIGTGSAASAAVWKIHSAGRRIAVVDWRPFGGTCALRGCDPKKVLVGAAETLDRLQRMAKK